ncbi:hypothetical protein [Arenibacter sp. F20364]|uniref:hypothetical protein n=1 Tax=Arenibacter sp. F20364 TaxID=2926415 RepID=UPI001FF466C3|nr:hypothetical protein [Arenibacter sp. F20364]MCK0192602.1 hypothetical protein [Arenibacter sp. F20364]
MSQVKNHDVQSVNIQTSVSEAFEYLSNPLNLPNWTGAFKEVDGQSALLLTPKGEIKIGLETKINRETGTIDWYMSMPDGSMGIAYSRVVNGPDNKAIYSFVLIAPPGPLEEIEGTLNAQIGQLKEELRKLKTILEKE